MIERTPFYFSDGNYELKVLDDGQVIFRRMDKRPLSDVEKRTMRKHIDRFLAELEAYPEKFKTHENH